MSDKSISHAISGGLSGLVSMTLTYPLVTLSTNAQAKTSNGEQKNEVVDKLKDVTQQNDEKQTDNTGSKLKLSALLKKLLQRIKFLIQYSKKYYSGLESALIGIVAVNFVYYYVYNIVGIYLKKINSKNSANGLNIKDSLITGLTAGVVSRVVTNPIWVANTRMTVKKKQTNDNSQDDEKTDKQIKTSNKNTFKIMYEIYQNEGFDGLFSGLGPALILVSSPVIQFTIFEQLKNLLIKFRKGKQLNLSNNITPIDALILGSLGKFIAILITYPYYTIRSRMHLSSQNVNSFKFLINIIKNEGIGSLYGGLNAKILQSVLSAGLVFYFKEEMMTIVGSTVNKCSNKSSNIVNLLRKKIGKN